MKARLINIPPPDIIHGSIENHESISTHPPISFPFLYIHTSSTLYNVNPKTNELLGIKGGKGPATSLFIDQIAKPTAAEGQAIVKIRAFGLNRMDLLQREGLYPLPPQAPPTMGVEFSGVIESFGPDGHEDFKVGDEVLGLAYGGAYAEYISVSTHMLVHKPQELSWEEAAGVPEVRTVIQSPNRTHAN